MTPEQALDRIGSLVGGARIVAGLAGGPASDSYLVERGADRWVLRIDTGIAARLGLDRGAEAAVLGHVHEHDLGPRLDFADVRAGIQLTQYIPGRAWTVADLNDRNGVTRLALMLQRLHGMSPVGAPFALCDRVARYAAGIGSSEAGALEAEIQVLLGRLATHDACLCHNDLVCTNVIEGDRLYLIDWEYAAVGDPFFDLATIVEHHSLADDVTQGLLHDYLGDVTHADRERLADWRQVYRHLLTLWRACVARP